MPTYTVLANVHEREFQNVQELAAIWGEIQGDIEERYGLDTRTHQVIDVERLGELVDDI